MAHIYTQTLHLVLSEKERGHGMNARVTTRPPALKRGEIAMEVTVRVPSALFARPTLRATIDIPKSAAPAAIDAAVCEDIAEVIRQQTGLAVTIEPATLSESGEGT